MKKALVVYHAEVEATTPEAAMRKAKQPPLDIIGSNANEVRRPAKFYLIKSSTTLI